MKKKRPKNKQEISSFSGVRKKKKIILPENKPKVVFEFIADDGVIYNFGRLKIDTTGGVSFLINTVTGWKPIKGKLKWIKIKSSGNLQAKPSKKKK